MACLVEHLELINTSATADRSPSPTSLSDINQQELVPSIKIIKEKIKLLLLRNKLLCLWSKER